MPKEAQATVSIRGDWQCTEPPDGSVPLDSFAAVTHHSIYGSGPWLARQFQRKGTAAPEGWRELGYNDRLESWLGYKTWEQIRKRHFDGSSLFSFVSYEPPEKIIAFLNDVIQALIDAGHFDETQRLTNGVQVTFTFDGAGGRNLLIRYF